MNTQAEDSKSTMDQADISRQPPRRRRYGPALQARIERALQELPLAEADITAVAEKLASKLARYRSNSLWNSSAFLDFRGKVTAVCDHFASEGLTLDNYLRAARRRPQLFIKSPATIIANIEKVAAHFSRYDLIRRRYLHAAVKSPVLFTMSPVTVIANVEAVVDRFAGDGLTLQQYLEAALKQPQLFYQSSATIIRHFDYLIEMYCQGLLTLPGERQTPPEQPLRPLFAFLPRRPWYLILGDDNYALRIRYAQVTGYRLRGTELLDLPRHHIEEELAHALDNDDTGQPPR